MDHETEIFTVWFKSSHYEAAKQWHRLGEVPRGASSEEMHRLCQISPDCTIGYRPHKVSKIEDHDCYVVQGLTVLTRARRLFTLGHSASRRVTMPLFCPKGIAARSSESEASLTGALGSTANAEFAILGLDL